MSSRNLSIFIRILFLAIVAVLLYFNNKKTMQLKKQLKSFTFNGFDLFFINFSQHKLDTNYIGLQSNSLNCLYFSNVKNKINIEFETLKKEQINYGVKLLEYAKSKGFKVIITTYHNKTNYDKTLDAPVYQIYARLNQQQASKIAKEIYQTVFNCDLNTKFEIVS